MHSLSNKSKHIFLIVLVFALALGLRVWRLDLPFLESYNNIARQAITAQVARNFYAEGFHFFRPELDENGPDNRLFNAEFPVHTFLIGIVYRLAGGVHAWVARGISVFFSILAMFLTYLLCRKFFSWEATLGACLFLAISPLSLSLARSVQPESFMLGTTLGALYFFYRYFETDKNKYLVFSGFFLFLAVGAKIHNLYLLLPLAYLAWQKQGIAGIARDPKATLYVILSCLPILWYVYAWQMAQRYELVHMPFNYASRGPAESFLSLFFAPHYWAYLAKIFFVHLLTPLGVIFFSIGFFKRPGRFEDRFLFVWFFSVVFALLILWRVIIEHPYYQSALILICALFIARGVDRARAHPLFLKFLKNRPLILCAASLEILSVLYFYRGLYSISPKRLAILEAGQAVQRVAPKKSFVIASHETNASQLYYCDRKGWALTVTAESDSQLIERLERYRKKGAGYLVATSLGDWKRVPVFENYLRKKYRVVEENARYILMDLRT